MLRVIQILRIFWLLRIIYTPRIIENLQNFLMLRINQIIRSIELPYSALSKPINFTFFQKLYFDARKVTYLCWYFPEYMSRGNTGI